MRARSGFVSSILALPGAVMALGMATGVAEGALTISDPAVVIQASSSLGAGQATIPLANGVFDPVAETWRFTGSFVITSDTLDIIGFATVQSLVIGESGISIVFGVTAGAADTMFSIATPDIAFDALFPLEGRASGSVTVTDTDGNGATLTGAIGPGEVYRWAYNGPAASGGGTTFDTQVAGPVVADPFSSITQSENFPGGGAFAAFGAPVSSISGLVNFTLSAGDIASGTGVFVTRVPTPGSLGLVAAAGAMLAVRRRRLPA